MKSKIKKLWDEVENLFDDSSLAKNVERRLNSVFNLYLDELNAASDNVESKFKFSNSSTVYKEFK